jgi:hypothetical protein
MMLTALGDEVDFDRLVQRLDISSAGGFFFNIDRLSSWSFTVEHSRGTLETLRQYLEAGQPIIVPVDTELLPYWVMRRDVSMEERITDHAVVVVGMDDQYIYVNDPDFAEAPQMVELTWFYDAWQNFRLRYAVIRRRWRLWRGRRRANR